MNPQKCPKKTLSGQICHKMYEVKYCLTHSSCFKTKVIMFFTDESPVLTNTVSVIQLTRPGTIEACLLPDYKTISLMASVKARPCSPKSTEHY